MTNNRTHHESMTKHTEQSIPSISKTTTHLNHQLVTIITKDRIDLVNASNNDSRMFHDMVRHHVLGKDRKVERVQHSAGQDRIVDL